MKILIPIDGSECAHETLQWAANTLNKSDTEFYLVQNVEAPLDVPVDSYEIEKACENLNRAKHELIDQGFTVADIDYTQGDTADEICNYANKIEADQVLIGSHGRTGLVKILLGSVSSKVLEHCDRPVFVYRNTQKKRFEMMSPNKMLS